MREKSLERHIKNIIYLITQCRRETTSRLRTLANGVDTKQGYLLRPSSETSVTVWKKGWDPKRNSVCWVYGRQR